MPKPDEIILNYPADRIKALRTFTTGSDPSVEDELLVTLEKIYLKRVPPPVRTYLGELPSAPKRSRTAATPKQTVADDPGTL